MSDAMPLSIRLKAANASEVAERLGLTDEQEADLLKKLRDGHRQYAGTSEEARTVADIKRNLRGEALDILGYPCLAYPETLWLDPVLMECLNLGKKLLDLLEAT